MTLIERLKDPELYVDAVDDSIRALEIINTLIKDFEINHKWWCVSTHGKGDPCKCDRNYLINSLKRYMGEL